MTQLFLVRHGQTVGNVQHVWQGWKEGELTPLGVQQAKATAFHLAALGTAFAALYSSPLRRAWRTAKSIGRALDLLPRAHEGLKEICFGKVEGLTMDEFATCYPEAYHRSRDRSDLSYTWPGGENRAGFQQRTRRALEEIAAQHEGQSVVVVSHGGALQAILAHLFPEQLGQWWTYGLGNCSLTQIRLAPTGPQLQRFNDQSHLEELNGKDALATPM